MTDAWSYFLEFKDERFELAGDDLTVGRSRTCDVSIKDPSVSRKHVHLTTGGGKILVRDLGSSNGTFVNGERIRDAGELGGGDVLGLGDADVRVEITSRAGFETVRMPQMPAEVGEATSVLQQESMRLAKETLGDDLEDSPGPVPAEPEEAGSHVTPPPAAAPAPPATFAGPAPAAAGPDPPAAAEEVSFAGLADGEPDFDPPAAVEAPSFAVPGEEPSLEAPDFPVVDEEPGAPASSPPPAGLEPGGEPELNEVEISPPEPPRIELPEPPPEAPVKPSEPPPREGDTQAVTDVRAPSPPETPPEAPPAADGEAPPAQRSGDELLPSLDGFDTTLGPGTPIPDSMLRAQESMAKARAEAQEPVPKPYEQPIQIPPMAGFGVRLLAALLDDLWILALAAAGWVGMEELGAAAAAGVSLLVVLTGWAIWGTTPGKRLLGLYVCTADGQAGLGLARAALRLLGYAVSAALAGIGFLMILSSSRRGLHDRIAGTYVRRFQ